MLLTQVSGRADAIDITETISIIPDRPIDLDQLSRASQNDSEMMRQLLTVFDLQADMLLTRMASQSPKAAAAGAHTLAVSARVVGAWKVAECAAAFEQIALEPGPVMLSSAMNRLSVAVTEAQAEIAGILS